MTIYNEKYEDIKEEAKRLIKTFYSSSFSDNLDIDDITEIDEYVTENILRDYNSDTEEYEILRELYNTALHIIESVKHEFDERYDAVLVGAVKDELINMKIKIFNHKIQKIDKKLRDCNEKIFNLISEKKDYLNEIEKLRGVE